MATNKACPYYVTSMILDSSHDPKLKPYLLLNLAICGSCGECSPKPEIKKNISSSIDEIILQNRLHQNFRTDKELKEDKEINRIL